MCEGYTIGGDASIKIEEDIRCCQTFTPTYTHTIAYLDLDCKLCAFYRRPTILIVTTDDEGKPTDNIVTTGRTSWLAKYPTDELVRVRFNLDWATVYEGVLYAVVIYFPRPGTGQYIWWQYDTAGATYDGGMRGESMDRGETWTLYPDSDFMFFEFGKEPAPLPSPDPPVGNFAILDLQQEVTATGIKITVTTNVPCHLYCYWTAKEPEKHLIPILTRGIELHTQLKMCFVNWNENEQEEAGDTLFHTFTKEPWAHCETRWLTFRAKVMENWVKSVGPIFKKHRVWTEPPPPTEFEKYLEPHDVQDYLYLHRWSAQTFTPQLDYTIVGVSLLLGKWGVVPSMKISIREVASDWIPSGPDLASVWHTFIGLPETPDSAWRYIAFDTPYLLVKDKPYAIVTGCPAGDPWDYYTWRLQMHGNFYLRGEAPYSIDSGVNWTQRWDYDHPFITWGY